MTAASQRTRRVAVVTPYCGETQDILRRNIDSVSAQTYKADHILVADGAPQEWVGTLVSCHIRLPTTSGDNGDTPRAVGIAFACSQAYDAIGLLDADCYFLPDAVERCIAVAEDASVPLVVGRRAFVRPDGSQMRVPDEPVERHIDTNCYFFLRPAFRVLLSWALIPPAFHPVDDRVIRGAVANSRTPYAVVDGITVMFTTRYAAHYRAAGEPPPAESKTVPWDRMRADWAAMQPERRDEFCAALGFQIGSVG
jgi:glycosyltransferase involved in cell wall biosynthesis